MAENESQNKVGNLQPIIIKKIKKGGHGHHGGAWKVAYADFVTAMMAFFLLLWLLNVTTDEQKEGIAEYFSPTVAVSPSSGGSGVFGGQSAFENDSKMDSANPFGFMVDHPVSDCFCIFQTCLLPQQLRHLCRELITLGTTPSPDRTQLEGKVKVKGF